MNIQDLPFPLHKQPPKDYTVTKTRFLEILALVGMGTADKRQFSTVEDVSLELASLIYEHGEKAELIAAQKDVEALIYALEGGQHPSEFNPFVDDYLAKLN